MKNSSETSAVSKLTLHGLSAARNDLPAYKGIESGFAAEFQSFFLIRFRNEKHHADTHVEDTERFGIFDVALFNDQLEDRAADS